MLIGLGLVAPGFYSLDQAFDWTLFGLIRHATYDLTNLATLREWPLLVTVVDLVWGTVLTAAMAAVSVWAGRKLK